jgi:glycosyltransferase involved in cell wall biosynthesis
MNVLHVSAANSQSGAGKAVLLTHEALLNLNHCNSKILFLSENNFDNKFIYSYANISFIHKIVRFIFTTLDRTFLFLYFKKKLSLFSPGFFGVRINSLDVFKWADIIHVHWANHGFINISHIHSWNKPVVWTLRDMWAFTGGCHVASNCNNFNHQCTNCPVLNSIIKYDLSTYVFNRKKKIFSETEINWVAISSWMIKTASESAILARKKMSLIYSGIRTDVFKLHNKKKSRLDLGIGIEDKVILIGATSLADEHKGFYYIKRILEKYNKEIILISFGSSDGINFNNDKVRHLNFGYIFDDDQLAKIYSSADLYLAPSFCDAFGKTVAEAQSCGTPVLCFSETGPADIVEHLSSGYVAQIHNFSDLFTGFKYCLNESFNNKYIRNRAVKLFDIKISAQLYFELYRQILIK